MTEFIWREIVFNHYDINIVLLVIFNVYIFYKISQSLRKIIGMLKEGKR